MRLIARLVGRSLHVIQQGAFDREASALLRAVHQRSHWRGSSLTWEYPYSPGSVAALRDVARTLEADLQFDEVLLNQEKLIEAENKKELAVRQLIQTYMDDRKLEVREHTTQPVPPPWRHQSIAFQWNMRVRCWYGALKPGLGKTRIGSDVIRGRVELGHVTEPTHIELPSMPSVVDPKKILPPRWGITGGVLITCPRVVVGEWVEQLKKWQNIDALPIVGDASKKRYRAGIRRWVHVCGYDSLESVEGNEYDGFIADEAHYIANDESNRFQRMMGLRRHAKWVMALSGTPISNMLSSLWAQYYWLDYGRTLGPSFDQFKEKFLTHQGNRESSDLLSERSVSKAISRVTMFLTMSEAFPDKPQKVHQVVRVPLTKEQARYYEQVRKQQATDVLTGTVTAGEAIVRLGKLMQIVQGFVYDDEKVTQEFSSAKLKALEDMLTGDGDLADRRTLVWCFYDPELDKIEAMLKRKKVKYTILRANMTDADRERMKHEWNNDASFRVLVGKINMGIGLNLHAPSCIDAEGKPAKCFTTVFYTLTWRVTVLEQAMDRTYRGDQTESCLYRYLLSDDLDETGDDGEPLKTIDVRVYESLQAKLDQGVNVSESSIEFVRSLLAA